MATVINSPAASGERSSASFLISAVLLLLAVALFLYYGLPALRSAGGSSGSSVSAPERVDINVNGAAQGQ